LASIARNKAYKNLKAYHQYQENSASMNNVPFVLPHRIPTRRQVLVRVRTGWAKQRALASLRIEYTAGVVYASRAFEHLQMPPLFRHAQELMISILQTKR
jgi:hypothetical protein